MNPQTPNPEGSLDSKVLTAEAWKAASAVGSFTNFDVYAFWGNGTHYDTKYSAWLVDQPEGATHVTVIVIDSGLASIPRTEPAT